MDERAHSAAVPAGPPPQTAPFWPVAERLVRHGAWFVIFVVLAPLLGPHDYGLFVVAMAGVAIIETLLSEVAARAIMALEPLEEAHLSTAFLANIAVGAAMSLLLYGVADEFAAMADDAVLGDIYQSLAVLPALSA
jgi:O-antigen/teichoic acid export membrane protein